MAPQTPKQWYTQLLPYLWPLLTFLVGFGANFLNTQNDLKNLTVAVNKLTDKVDKRDESQDQLGNRVTALETVNKQAPAIPTPPTAYYVEQKINGKIVLRRVNN